MTKSYVMGTNAVFFDPEFVKKLRDTMFCWKLFWSYQSNWRVLHIDGFEGPTHKFPVRTGEPVRFFSYAEAR